MKCAINPPTLLRHKSGVYLIRNIINEKVYIGKSTDLLHRYRQHTSNLRTGMHPNQEMKNDYNLYGGNAFLFDIIEECILGDMKKIEQEWIDVWWNDGILYNRHKQVSKRSNNGVGKPVDCYTLEGKFIESFNTIKGASIKYGLRISQITWVCQEKHRQAGGFLWVYKGGSAILRPHGMKRPVYTTNKEKVITKYDSIRDAANKNAISEYAVVKFIKDGGDPQRTWEYMM